MPDRAKHGKVRQQTRLQIDVTILQQINGNSLQSLKSVAAPHTGRPQLQSIQTAIERDLCSIARLRKTRGGDLLAQSSNAVREPRHFPLRRVAVHDVLLRRTNDHRLGFSHSGERDGAIAGGDRLFNFAHRGPQARTPRLVDDSAAHRLAPGLFGRLRIGQDRYQVFVKRRL